MLWKNYFMYGCHLLTYIQLRCILHVWQVLENRTKSCWFGWRFMKKIFLDVSCPQAFLYQKCFASMTYSFDKITKLDASRASCSYGRHPACTFRFMGNIERCTLIQTEQFQPVHTVMLNPQGLHLQIINFWCRGKIKPGVSKYS